MAAWQNGFGQPIGQPMPNWTARPFPSTAPETGRFCRIEKLDSGRHAKDLFLAYAQATDARDWTYLFAEPCGDEGAFTQHMREVSAKPDPLHYAIIDAMSGKATGSASLMRIEPTHGVIEVGHIHYSPALQRSRAATEAMYLLMRRVFDELGYRRYEWKCDSLNAPSRRAAERLGFRFEGIFRQAIVYKGRSRDTAWYSIIDSEWPSLRAAFEHWLAPENFDTHGVQKQSLAAIRGVYSANAS